MDASRHGFAVIDPAERDFMAGRRTATLATLSSTGSPRLVPVCFVIGEPEPGLETTVWTPLDDKPKQSPDPRHLARVRDVLARPEVWLLFERWSEDWSSLAWLRARGTARLVEPGDDPAAHRAAAALRDKYRQYRAHALDVRPMIRIAITRTVFWQASST